MSYLAATKKHNIDWSAVADMADDASMRFARACTDGDLQAASEWLAFARWLDEHFANAVEKEAY